MNRKEYVAQELHQLQQVLELAEVAEEVYEQFPEDEEAIRNFHKARATRMIYIHRAFVNIMGAYDECTDYMLVDLMERKFESEDNSEEIDQEVEKYFGELERKRQKKIIYKRLDDDDTTA